MSLLTSLANPPMTTTPAQKLMRYKKLEQIGRGAYGSVYKAQDTETGDIVAMKRIKLGGNNEEGVPFTCIREVSLLKELNHHPNVVRLRQVIQTQNEIYLVLDYIEYDLKNKLDHYGVHLQQCIPAQDIKWTMYQLVKGVAYCHSQKILHRDLKPQNILITEDGEVKLADFGLARTFQIPTRPLTHEVVTMWYKAPELLLGSQIYSTQVDIWSIGCIFAELCSGKVLFKGDSDIGMLYTIFQVLGTPSEEVWGGVTDLPNWRPIFPKWHGNLLASLVPSLCPEGLDLMQKMLVYQPNLRITAKQALEHPYFADVQ